MSEKPCGVESTAEGTDGSRSSAFESGGMVEGANPSHPSKSVLGLLEQHVKNRPSCDDCDRNEERGGNGECTLYTRYHKTDCPKDKWFDELVARTQALALSFREKEPSLRNLGALWSIWNDIRFNPEPHFTRPATGLRLTGDDAMIRIGELFKKEVLEMWNEYCDSEKKDSVLKMVFGEAFSSKGQKGSLLGGGEP